MSLTPEVRRKLGMKRAAMKPFIYHELGKRNMNATKIAEALGCSITSVSRTILGESHSPRVLDALRAAGVPEEYLFDPRYVRGQASYDLRECV